MLIWLIKDGELLPAQAGGRTMRTGMVAAELVKRSHTVIWWSSTFSHQRKTLLHAHDTDMEVERGFQLKLLQAGGYKRNISLQRYWHHRRLAWRFRQQSAKMQTPDVVVAAFPIIDLAHEAVEQAHARNCPVIVDIRDLWPDSLVDKSPRLLQPAVRRCLGWEYRKIESVLRSADSLVATSKGYLQWGLNHAGRSRTDYNKVFYTGYPEGKEEKGALSERMRKLQRAVDGNVVFTFIGSFGFSYELDLICEVARRALSGGLDAARFVIAGDGQQFDEVSERAKSLPNVSVTGWLDRNELRHLLSMSSVGLVPCISVADTWQARVPSPRWFARTSLTCRRTRELRALRQSAQ
jgi:hypothetical protein